MSCALTSSFSTYIVQVEIPGRERGGLISAQLCKGNRCSPISSASQVMSLGSGHVALWEDCHLVLLVTLYEGTDHLFLDKKCSLKILRSSAHANDTGAQLLGSLSLPISAIANERERSSLGPHNAQCKKQLQHVQAKSTSGRATDIYCDLNVTLSFGEAVGDDDSPMRSDSSVCTATSFDDAAFGTLKLHVIELENRLKELHDAHQKKEMQLSKAKSRITDLKSRLARALDAAEQFADMKVVAAAEPTVVEQISDAVDNEDPPSQVALAVLRIENSRLRYQLLEAQEALLSADINSFKSPGKEKAVLKTHAPETLTGSSNERSHSSGSAGAGYAPIKPVKSFIYPSSSAAYVVMDERAGNGEQNDADDDNEYYYTGSTNDSAPGNPFDSPHSSEVNNSHDDSDLGWCDGGMSALFPSPSRPTSDSGCQTDQKCRFLDLATGTVSITGADTTTQVESIQDTSSAVLENLSSLSIQLEMKMSDVTLLQEQVRLLKERSKAEARERHKKEKEKMLVLEAHMLEIKTELRARGDMVDEERAKVHALKAVLVRLTKYFSTDDKQNLYLAGVILTGGVL